LRKIDELYEKAAICFDKGDFEGAKSYAQKCLKLDQKEFRVLNLLGVVLSEEGKLDSAKNAYLKSIEANPKNPQTLNNLGNMYAKTGDGASAIEYYKKAIAADGSFLTARYNLAKTLGELRYYDEAIDEAYRCLELEPSFLRAYLTIGICLKEQKHYAEAKDAYIKALQDETNVVDALINLGVLAKDEKNLAESEAYLRKAAEIAPNNELVFNNLGVTLHAAKKYAEAIEAFFRSIAIFPQNESAFSNLSSLLMEIGDYQKAKGAILKALEINPNSVPAYTNFGVLLKWLGDYEESAKAFMKAVELDPSNTAARVNLGILLMLFGDFAQGLPLYEMREKSSVVCDKPLWSGEELEGKTILVYHEQGFGDTINFARLLTHKAFQGAKIIFSPQDALQPLFKSSALPCITMNHEEIEAQKPHFDYHTSLVSLLFVLNITKNTIPPSIDYIAKDAKKVEFFASKIPQKPLKIGIVWQGNKQYVGDTKRSIPAQLFDKLKDERISFVSLQKEFDAEDLAHLGESIALLDFSGELNDFADTAALIAALDMVITVDTSVAHLAATMGKPTWVLLPVAPDWRWGLEGESTPWYASARLFRQAADANWDKVIEKIKGELQKTLQ
jgi:tetratricopeptide (TPR) repeat protein